MLSDKSRFKATRDTILRMSGNSPAVLVTSTPDDLIPGDPPPRCAILQLDTVLCIDHGRGRLEEDPFYAALRGPSRQRGDAIGYSFSPGYRSAIFGNQEFSFTNKQAQVIEALHKAWRTGPKKLHQREIQGAVDSAQRVVHLFRGHPAHGTLIKYDGDGYYWLDL